MRKVSYLLAFSVELLGWMADYIWFIFEEVIKHPLVNLQKQIIYQIKPLKIKNQLYWFWASRLIICKILFGSNDVNVRYYQTFINQASKKGPSRCKIFVPSLNFQGNQTPLNTSKSQENRILLFNDDKQLFQSKLLQSILNPF